MITYHPTYRPPVKPKKVTFSILSPEETRKMSVVSINESTIYYRGLPNAGGINDALMGTVDRRLLCGTCMKDVKLCQGLPRLFVLLQYNLMEYHNIWES